MCEQQDAMRAVRAAAECLAAVCRARQDPTLRAMASAYDGVVAEPVPDTIMETLHRLENDGPGH